MSVTQVETMGGGESGTKTLPQERLETLIAQIRSDRKVDGWDSIQLDTLLQVYNQDKENIFLESRQSVRDIMKEVLEKWYTVKNENDYNSLVKMLQLCDSSYQIPEFSEIKSKIKITSQSFSVVLDSGKNILTLYKDPQTYPYISHNFAWKIDLSNGSYNFPFFGWFNRDICDNNKIDVSLPEYARNVMEGNLQDFPLVSTAPKNGHATLFMIWKNGAWCVYQGDFKDGKMHGKWTMIYENHSMYKWDFVNGMREWQGTYLFKNGNTFTWGWQANKKSSGIERDYHGSFIARYENWQIVETWPALSVKSSEISTTLPENPYDMWKVQSTVENALESKKYSVNAQTSLNIRNANWEKIGALQNWTEVTLTGNTKTVNNTKFVEITWWNYVALQYLSPIQENSATLTPTPTQVATTPPDQPQSPVDAPTSNPNTFSDLENELKEWLTLKTEADYAAFAINQPQYKLPTLETLFDEKHASKRVQGGEFSLRKIRKKIFIYYWVPKKSNRQVDGQDSLYLAKFWTVDAEGKFRRSIWTRWMGSTDNLARNYEYVTMSASASSDLSPDPQVSELSSPADSVPTATNSSIDPIV